MKGQNHPLQAPLVLITLALPWLFTFTSGPSPSVPQWLLCTACGVLLWLMRAGLRPELVLSGWMLAAMLNAIVALLQYAGAEHLLAPWAANGVQREAYGQLRQRNQFATLENLGLAAVMWLPSLSPIHRGNTRSWMFALAALLGVANAATMSRTGLMQLLLLGGLVTMWGLWRTHVARLLLIAMTAYIISSFVLPYIFMPGGMDSGIWVRMQQGSDNCGSRLTLWRNVLALIAVKPWTGWGWGELDYAHFITLYQGVRFCEILDNAHNLPLHLGVELGVPVALLLGGLGLRLGWRARPWREMNADRQVAWAVIGLILLHSMSEYPLWFGPFQLAALLSVWVLLRSAEQPYGKVAQLSWRMRDLVVTVVALTGLGYAAWDYYRISQIFYPPAFRSAAYRENTLEKIRGTWLYQDQVQFAEFTLTPLTPGNAEHLYEMGQKVLHYSPEARVVEKLIECAVLLGRDDVARFYLARYKAAFPKEHARWTARQMEPAKPR